MTDLSPILPPVSRLRPIPARQRREILALISSGEISAQDACIRWGLSPGELAEWTGDLGELPTNPDVARVYAGDVVVETDPLDQNPVKLLDGYPVFLRPQGAAVLRTLAQCFGHVVTIDMLNRAVPGTGRRSPKRAQIALHYAENYLADRGIAVNATRIWGRGIAFHPRDCFAEGRDGRSLSA